MLLFFILLGVPLIEIALFVVIGGRIGLAATLAIVLATAVIGAYALRGQGLGVLRRAQNLSRPEEVSDVLVDGLFLFAAGLLLLTPGFLTDSIGFLLLIPPVRRWLARRLGRYAAVTILRAETSATPHPETRTDHAQSDDSSPWAQQRSATPKREEADDAVVIDRTDADRRR